MISLAVVFTRLLPIGLLTVGIKDLYFCPVFLWVSFEYHARPFEIDFANGRVDIDCVVVAVAEDTVV